MGSIQLFYVAALEILKLHYESHTSNPMTYHPIKMAIARLWKCYIFLCVFVSYYGRCDFNQIEVGKTFFWFQFGTLNLNYTIYLISIQL
jgi:hypothetical protein